MKLRKLLILLVVMGLIGLPVMVYAGEESGTGSQENTGGETNPSGGESGGNESGQGEETTTEVKISLNKDKLELIVDGTEKLKVEGTDKTVTWSSNEESVATVENGTVKAISAGTAIITAKVDDKVTATCTVTVKEKEETPKEIDYRIKKLILEGATITPKFSPDVENYAIQIINFDKFKIDAELMDKNAGIIIGKHDKLKDIKDNNGIIIVITDSDKTARKTYTFTYEENELEQDNKETKEEKNVNLASLKMTGYAFNESFDKDVTDYTVMIPYEVTEITVDAVAEDKDAKVTISSTKGLDVGGNRVTVTVTNGDKKKVYNLYVTRSEQTETEEVPTSIIGPSSSSSSSNGSDLELPDVDDPDSTLNKITVTIASIVIFLMGAIGVYFFISTSPKRMKKEVLSKKRKEKQIKVNSPMVEVSNKEEIEDLEPTKEIRRK